MLARKAHECGEARSGSISITQTLSALRNMKTITAHPTRFRFRVTVIISVDSYRLVRLHGDSTAHGHIKILRGNETSLEVDNDHAGV